MEKLRFLGDDDGDYGMYPEKQISDSNQLLMHRMNFNAQKHEVQIGMLEKKVYRILPKDGTGMHPKLKFFSI